MLRHISLTLLLVISCCAPLLAHNSRSIQSFDVKPSNSAAVNKVNLQKAIDWASQSGAALFVEPSDEPYPINGGLILKRNASLIGVHGPTPRGTSHASKKQPVGSVLAITDKENVFMVVEAATQIKGIQFWYPEQTLRDPDAIIPYPATIQVSKTSNTQGVYLCTELFKDMGCDFVSCAMSAVEDNPVPIQGEITGKGIFKKHNVSSCSIVYSECLAYFVSGRS